MAIEIRKYERKDHIHFSILSTDKFKQIHRNIPNLMRNKNDKVSQCYVAVLDKNIVAYIYGFLLPNDTIIPHFLYVRTDYRHQGIGKMLLKEFEKNSGCHMSMVFYNKDLHDYYEQQGYRCGDNLEVAVKVLSPRKDGTL